MKEVTFTVDGKEITVPEGTLIIDACEQHGIYIPRFCYHQHLLPSGNCRMCLVKIEKNPKPQPSCMTAVANGMIIHTNTPEVQEIRKAMLEFILINHPLDCPICDKAGECMLQDQYMLFSGEKSRFNEEKVAKEKLYLFSDRILYDAERCITCSRCVRFTQEISKSRKLGMVERGDRSYVSLAPGDSFDDPYSCCVTDICPVGALTNRQFRFKERVWNLMRTDSVCAGCSRGCNISIHTRDNTIYRVVPRKNESVNKSWMCDFGRDYYVSPQKNRLTGTKINGKSKPYQAFVQAVAVMLKENAGEVAFILSSHATNEELALAKQLTDHLGIQSVFSKLDRTCDELSGETGSDDFLITSDKTPNMAGIKRIFPAAKDISKLKSDEFTHAFVWGANCPAEKLKNQRLIMLTTISEPITAKSEYLIAGRIPAEKHGSYTNSDGIVQPFRRAVKGTDNCDELMFFIELLNLLGVKPIGRTVDEVRVHLF